MKKIEDEIKDLKKKLEELRTEQPHDTTDVDRLLDYWDREDTIICQIKKLNNDLANGIDMLQTPEEIIQQFGIAAVEKM